MDTLETLNEAVDRFEHADPTHPPKQGFGTPLVVGLIAYSVVLTIAVLAYLIGTAI
ncbi:MAG: hypothetical protein ACIAQ0_02740 [Phycisphaerales bacterium JB058]